MWYFGIFATVLLTVVTVLHLTFFPLRFCYLRPDRFDLLTDADMISMVTKTLTRVYGTHFKQPDLSVKSAITDDHLMGTVAEILRLGSILSADTPGKKKVGDVKVEYYQKINSDRTFTGVDDEGGTLPASVPIEGDEGREPKAESLKFANEAAFFEQVPMMNGKLNGPTTMKRFQELTGYTVQRYLAKKSSTFNVTGNLNFWQYFVRQLSDGRNLSALKRSTSLEDGDTQSTEKVFLFSDAHAARTSNNNQFLLYDALINGSEFERLSLSHKVTVSTQTSMDRLLTFVESYQYWTGPISLAVFLNGPLEYFLLKSYLSFLERCHSKHLRQTCFSIATPLENPLPRNILIETDTFDQFDCRPKNTDVNVAFKKQLEETKAWLKTMYYPQNMMRNLARANIRTDYHITLDIDILPCPRMSEGLNKFLHKSTLTTNALAVPTYEVSRKIDFPQTKRELVSLTKKGLAQSFHRDVYLPNQNATNFPKWEKIHDSFEDVHVVHEVRQFPLHYEPFFVELNSNPFYDEGFIGYGFTRSSHAFEVFVRSGKFLILSPIYTAQLGIKKVKEWSDFRQEQNEQNRQRFDDFIRNITLQHPNLKRVEKNSSGLNAPYY